MSYILEVCADSVQSAIEAKKGGADRIELCSNLLIGGTTPGKSLFKLVKEHTGLPVRTLIRPRFGDFCYDAYEFEMMKEEVQMFCEMGADGVVIGILNPDGSLNMEWMEELVKLAGKAGKTLHRAFDMCKDPFETCRQAVRLGIDTILTSGQKNSAWEGRRLLADLEQEFGNEITLLAGAGVSPATIEELARETHLHAFHMSGKIIKESRMEFRREQVNMGLKGFSEYEIWQTSMEQVKKARMILDELNRK